MVPTFMINNSPRFYSLYNPTPYCLASYKGLLYLSGCPDRGNGRFQEPGAYRSKYVGTFPRAGTVLNAGSPVRGDMLFTTITCQG